MLPEYSDCQYTSSERNIGLVSVASEAIAPISERRNVIQCSQCTSDNSELATMFCNQCRAFLCDFHVQCHKRTKATQGHTLQAQIDQHSCCTEESSATLNCSVHPNEQVEVMCLDCNKLICFRCVIVNHMTHNRTPLSDVVLQKRQELSKHLRLIDEKIAEFQNLSKIIQERVAQVDSDAKGFISVIESLKSQKVWSLLLQEKALEDKIQVLRHRVDSLKNASDVEILNLNKMEELEAAPSVDENCKLDPECFQNLMRGISEWYHVQEGEEVEEEELCQPVNNSCDYVSVLQPRYEPIEKYEDLVLELVKHRGADALEYACDSMLDDKEFITKALARGGIEVFKFASERLKSDSDSILFLLINQRFSEIISFASPDLVNCKEFAIEAIRRTRGLAIQFLPELHRRDIDVVKEAVKFDITMMKFASEELLFNQEFIMEVLKYSHRVLEFIPRKWRENKEVVLELINRHGSLVFESVFVNSKTSLYDSIEYSKWTKDMDVMLAAIKKNPSALVYASDKLKSDRVLVLKAIRKSNGSALEYADSELKADKDFVLSAMHISKNCNTLEHASLLLRSDEQFMKEVIKEYSYNVLKFAGDSIKRNKAFMLPLIKESKGIALQFVAPDLIEDKNFAIEALRVSDGTAYTFCPSTLKQDAEIIRITSQINPSLVHY